MVQEAELSEVLSDFARTMVTDFPIQGILDHLVERIVEVLPVTSAGVTLISPGLAPRYIAASDDSALRFEQLQTDVGQGPCLLAYESGNEVTVPDLRQDGRFPVFSARAVTAGLLAVFTFPLRHRDGRLGALDLYRDTPGSLDQRALTAAQTLADVAAAYLINAETRVLDREASDNFRRGSLYDSLTGLPNRVLLQQRLEHATQRAQRSHTFAAVLFIDLDNFKHVNDAYGHEVGDQLLRAVAERLSALVRPGDTLARMYGDEFLFLCEDLPDVADAENLATRVSDSFAGPLTLDATDAHGCLELEVSASVGLAYAGPGEDITYRLIRDADIAMYEAKRKGPSRQLIDLREPPNATMQRNAFHDLRDAYTRGGLDLAYQPIVSTNDGHVTGVEALLRWTDPVHGPIPARTTVDVAEQSGLIHQIGAWVLERACREYSTWQSPRPDAALDLAVNISTQQLMAPGFVATVAAVLRATPMDPAALVLEMTESIVIDDFSRAMTILAHLKSVGVRLALDDFGTGYSSLSYLRQLPVDILKIDRGFIEDIGHEATAPAIIGAVTNLGHALRLTVTAEGVETPVQRDVITAIGCDHAQGFLFARPMPGNELADQLTAQHGRAFHLPTSATQDAAGAGAGAETD